jgi:S1-C subfamily serine protease
MASRTGLQGTLLGVVIVASMVVGGAVTALVTGDDAAAPVIVQAPEPVSSPLPVASTPADAAGSARGADLVASIAELPDLVADVLPSVVKVETSSGFAGGGGVGSGVIVDSLGHVVTNFHVIEGADEVSVLLADGTRASAEVVGVDPGNDLAVLRTSVQPQLLSPAVLADSDTVRIGEPVFAIGNPFDLDFTVTSGIVSGLERTSQSSFSGRPIRDVIQTDAVVNPGNSGGPLFNAAGEVVGINSSIENPTGQRVFVGVGFAVPSNTVARFLPEMIAGETVQHPQLGIAGVSLDPETASDAGVGAETGVYLTRVSAGSAAERAGLRAASVPDGAGLPAGGDVVTAIDGEAVTSIEQLARLIDHQRIGDSVTLTVVRGGDELTLTATLLEWGG